MAKTTLILNQQIREKLEAGYSALEAGNYQVTLSEAASSFVLVMRAKAAALSLETLDRPATLTRMVNQSFGFAPGSFGQIGTDERKFAENISNAVGKVVEAIDIIGYGLDYPSYLLLKSNGPIVHQMVDGDLHMDWWGQPSQDPVISQRCLDFVTEAAVKLGV